MYTTEKEVGVFQPLGIAYIAAVLEKNGHTVSIIDAFGEDWENSYQFDNIKKCRGLTFENIKKRIKQLSPDIVGITVPFTAQVSSALQVASEVKSVNNNIIVVFGGPHPTVKPESCLANPNVDIVVLGEGEYTFLDIVKSIERSADYMHELNEVNGIVFMKNNEIVYTKPREFIEDLDKIPFPARHLLPMEKYQKAVKKGKIIRGAATLFTSRGCPFHCTFCSIHLTMGRKWRARSPENVVDEIKQLIKLYGIKNIDFEDDNLTLDRKRMEEICNLIIRRNLKFKWRTPNGVRADTLDETLLRKMKMAGCEELRFAPESGVQRVINQIIGKNLDLVRVEEVIKLCKKVGIRVRCFFVIGLIGETKKDMLDTVRYARRLEKMGVGVPT